jgi:hypothetical protein
VIDVVRARLHRQHLRASTLTDPVDTVRWFGAMQAQEYLPARWSIGQRCGAGRAEIDAVLAGGAILRTHVLRPTWHFVAAADIRWLLAATAPRVHQLNAYYYRKTGLDPETAAKCRAVFEKALTGGAHRTRAELAAALAAAGLPSRELSLAYAVIHAELEGVIASGAVRGKQQTYALLDERLDGVTSYAPDDPLVELVRVYLRGHGPATVKDLLWWASLTVADIKRALAALGDAVVSVELGGRTYWDITDAPPPPAAPDPAPHVDLVQIYDEYVMAYTESRDVLAGDGVLPFDIASRLHSVLVDGRYLGRWGLTFGARSAALELQLPREVPVAAAVARLERFLGVPVEVQGSKR